MVQIDHLAWNGRTEVGRVKEPERYLLDAQRKLDRLGVIWFLGFGTALGLYRDGDFVPRDTDIDCCILLDDPAETTRIMKPFNEDYQIIRVAHHEGARQQAAFQGKDKFIIDLAFFYLEGDNWVSHHEGGNFVDHIDIIGNLKNRKTKYGTFPFPEHMRKYLAARYNDWETPRHGDISCSIKS